MTQDVGQRLKLYQGLLLLLLLLLPNMIMSALTLASLPKLLLALQPRRQLSLLA